MKNSLSIPTFDFLLPSIQVITTDEYGVTKPLVNDYESKCRTYGKGLLDLLQEESRIKLHEDNGSIILNQILTDNAHADATRLMGSIAEVLITKFCKQNLEVNRRLGMYARNSMRLSDSLDNFVAVATGSMQAKLHYPIFYNKSDTQRDIIWVHKENHEQQLTCVDKLVNAAKPAGIQVKVSHNYSNILGTLKQYHYPILYFDLNNDWWQLSNAVKYNGYNCILIPHDDITNEIKMYLRYYFDIIVKIFTGEISLEYLIDLSKYNGFTEILKGLELASNNPIEKKIIIPV